MNLQYPTKLIECISEETEDMTFAHKGSILNSVSTWDLVDGERIPRARIIAGMNTDDNRMYL